MINGYEAKLLNDFDDQIRKPIQHTAHNIPPNNEADILWGSV